jgi:drug/metabolite transporter (DMT)-like permease
MSKSVTNSPNLALYVLVIGVLAVSTGSIFVRFAQTEAPSLIIATYRITGASLILLLTTWKKTLIALRKLSKSELYLIFGAGLFLALHFATWISSLEYTSITSSVVLVTTTPLWVALFSPILLKEKISTTTIIGLLIAFAGAIIIGISDSCSWDKTLACLPVSEIINGDSVFGNILALMGALAAAGFTMLGRKLRLTISFFPYITILYTTASIFLIILVAAMGLSPVGYLPKTYFWMILLAIVPQLIGHSSFNFTLGYLPASYVSIALLGEPIGSIILAFLLLNEIPTSLTLVGAAIILFGILIPTLYSKNGIKNN